ncbi:MAG: DUF6458 family protein [Mycobacteriales bacterium]
MGIGVSVFLIAVGAVLTFAVHFSTPDVAIHTVGYILMGAGTLGLLLFLFLWGNHRRVVDPYVDELVAPPLVQQPPAPSVRSRM